MSTHRPFASLRDPLSIAVVFTTCLALLLCAEHGMIALAQSSESEPITERQFFNLYERGAESAAEDNPERALADWLEAFDRSRGVPGLEEARLTLPLDGMLALAESYTPAHKALVARRDRAERALVETRAIIEDAEEVVALNALLAGPERSIEAYDRYSSRRDADPGIASVLRDLLWSDLIAAGRYAELAGEAEIRANELIPLLAHAREAMRRQAEAMESGEEMPEIPVQMPIDEDAGEIWHESGDDMDLVAEAIELYEVLVGSGRSQPAEALRNAVLLLEPEAGEAMPEVAPTP